jgi:signal transduction histidine kinase
MPTTRPRPGPPLRVGLRWLRPPRRSARLRLTVMYGAAFLVCGAAVLGVYAYLIYAHDREELSSGQFSPAAASAATATLNRKVPVADVHRAGSYDVIPIPVPSADVHQAGRYDTISFSVPVAVAKRQTPALTAAQDKQLLADVRAKIDWASLEVLTICAGVLAVIAVAAAAIGWFIAGRVLRPLRTITTTARRIAASSLHERLDLHGPDDELKELGDTLDNLFARLEASFEAQRRFAANASHELRTPLTRERTLLQVTLADPASTAEDWRAASRELLASNAEQERLIEALLTLANGEAGVGQREPVDLADITGEALAVPRPAIGSPAIGSPAIGSPPIGRFGLNVQADIQPAILEGDPLLVQQLVTNLIDNAVRHNIPGGDVRVATGTSDGHAVLSVANSGQVIPPAEVDRLFQPFQRLGPRPARRDGGHGLGLSIVRAIATAHGATIAARARPEGGLAVEVTFLPPPSGLGAASGIRPGIRKSAPMRVSDTVRGG